MSFLPPAVGFCSQSHPATPLVMVFCSLWEILLQVISLGSLGANWLIAAGAYLGFCSMKWLEVFLPPLDRMLVHRRSLPWNLLGFPQQFAATHLYTWVERGTVRVKCLAQEHNTMFLARARTQTACSGVERTNHEATAPPTTYLNLVQIIPLKVTFFTNS